jgi:hypothetical protein
MIEDHLNGQIRPEVKQISARKLARRLRTMPVSLRIRLAVDLVDGAVAAHSFTPKQAAEFTDVSVGKINKLRRARAGGSLAATRRERAIEHAIARIIRTAGNSGFDQLAQRIEQLKPQAQAAE